MNLNGFFPPLLAGPAREKGLLAFGAMPSMLPTTRPTSASAVGRQGAPHNKPATSAAHPPRQANARRLLSTAAQSSILRNDKANAYRL